MNNINRVFDQTRPSQEQKEAMLDRLLISERKVVPMRKLKKLTAVGIAAALMVVTCAAAVVTGLDQRLANYFGVGPEQAELLAPGALPVDITAENNGAVFHVSQVLMDRSTVLVLADFTAPEGTVLDMSDPDRWGSVELGQSEDMPRVLDKDGGVLPSPGSCAYHWQALTDEDPAYRRLTLLFTMSLPKGTGLGREAAYFWLEARDLTAYDREQDQDVVLCSGDWSVQIPLPEKDMGWTQTVDDTVVKEIYLSPMTLVLTTTYVDGCLEHDIALTDRDGREIPISFIFASVNRQIQSWNFRLDEITDPSLLQGGALTVNGQSIPLDALVPAE